MGVIVFRGLGDQPGSDIISEVLTTEDMQRERGRQEINSTDSDRLNLSGNCVNTSYMPPGSIVQTTDSGGSRKGYLDSYSKNVGIEGGYTSNSAVTLEQVEVE